MEGDPPFPQGLLEYFLMLSPPYTFLEAPLCPVSQLRLPALFLRCAALPVLPRSGARAKHQESSQPDRPSLPLGPAHTLHPRGAASPDSTLAALTRRSVPWTSNTLPQRRGHPPDGRDHCYSIGPARH
ncbi:hypothetical protein NDU88_000294 [Pleurodeles waltl]|uniref:Uncharacterized protein n=1 Tax=Pleurodeles waltl TaxID=8319 RepID=A0AAV7KN16_PLEWA|nr:hypothetical protein NDU88_000294 [Pleurodeles waltl]